MTKKRLALLCAAISIIIVIVTTGVISLAGQNNLNKPLIYDEYGLVSSESSLGIKKTTKAQQKKLDKIVENVDSVSELAQIQKETGVEAVEAEGATVNEVSGDIKAVDNTTSIYAPKVSTQGSLNACTLWAMVYYQQTYMMNRAKGVEAKDGDAFSAVWAYSLINGGENRGTYTFDAIQVMYNVGGISEQVVPNSYTDEAAIKNWKAEDGIWEDASINQIDSFYNINYIYDWADLQFVEGADDESIAPLKKALEDGEVLSFTTAAFGWQINQVTGDSHKNEYIITGTNVTDYNNAGYHRCVIAGYDDSIWFDYDKDNIKDKAELGAFKVVNSWGAEWGNNGCIWVSYDSLNLKSVASNEVRNEVTFNEIYGIAIDAQKEEPRYMAKFNMNTKNRETAKVLLTYDDGSNLSSYYMVPFYGVYTGGNLSFSGTGTEETGTFATDLDNVLNNIDFEKFQTGKWSMEFSDTVKDGADLDVSGIKIYDKVSGKEYVPDIASFTLNGDVKKVNFIEKSKNTTTIFYSGFENPKIHYKIDGGSWTTAPGIAMEKSTEVEGFPYQYTMDLGDASGVTVCFNDGKGTWDSNNSKNYYFKAGKFTFKNSIITQLSDATVSAGSEDTIIYYSGYDNPYIHYKIGSGAWTTPPGILMSQTDELSGFTHKINLNTNGENSITACFNDGNGKWDSNGGSNYVFGTGIYTYKNGVISRIDDANNLQVHLQLSGTLELGTTTSILAYGQGGMKPYKYTIGYNFDGKENILLNKSLEGTVEYVFQNPGAYTFFVKMEDFYGYSAYREITIQVK